MTEIFADRDSLESSSTVAFGNSREIGEEEGDPRYLKTLTLTHEQWEELGCPEEVTVTVELGNALEARLSVLEVTVTVELGNALEARLSARDVLFTPGNTEPR